MHHCHLLLGALTTADIREAYEATRIYQTGEPFSAFLAATTPALLDELCAKVCELIGGLPRMVHACLEGLCRLQRDRLILDSSAAIDAALEMTFREAHSGDLAQHLTCDPDSWRGPLRGVYSVLLLASLLGVRFDGYEDEIAIDGPSTAGNDDGDGDRNGHKAPLLDVACQLSLFVDRDRHGALQIRVAEWTMRMLAAR